MTLLIDITKYFCTISTDQSCLAKKAFDMARNDHGLPVPEPSQKYKITYKKADGEEVERPIEVRMVYYKQTGFSVRFLDNGKQDCSVVMGVNRQTNRPYWLLLRHNNHQKAEKVVDASWLDE